MILRKVKENKDFSDCSFPKREEVISAQEISKELHEKSNLDKAKVLSSFFKTGKGHYGEGDVFLGVVVSEQRKTAKKFKDLSLKELQKLLKSKIHEERLTALFILISQYERAENIEEKKRFVNFYLKNLRYVNNWDLVDISAPKILGGYLLEKDKSRFFTLAKSKQLWEKRAAIVSTLAFIRKEKFDATLKISNILLHDSHDLIHKAVGWMLRELGKKNQEIEEEFLRLYRREMPRMMLRYAIERFDDEKREFYLSKN